MKHYDSFDLKYWVCDRCGSISRFGTFTLYGADFCRECWEEMMEGREE